MHSSSNPRVRAPWVLGRGHWVGSEFHRDMVSAGFIQELRSFVVTGVTWWPCYLKITWRFKNIAGGPFFISYLIERRMEWKRSYLSFGEWEGKWEHFLKTQRSNESENRHEKKQPEFPLSNSELNVEFKNHVLLIIWTYLVIGACCNTGNGAKIQKWSVVCEIKSKNLAELTNVNFIIQIGFLAGHGCDVYWPATVSCHIKVQFANSTKQHD